MTHRAPSHAATRPGSIGFQWVGRGALVLLGVALTVGWFGYLGLIRYERRGLDHVPPSARWAVVVDVESVIAFDPVRQHLLPLLDEGSNRQRLRRLRDEENLNITRDLREILIAGNGSHWVVGLGGLFSGSRLIDPIERAVVQNESWPGWARRGNRLLQISPPGPAMAQAADGLWLIADSESFLAEALAASNRAKALGLVAGADATWGLLRLNSAEAPIGAMWRLPGLDTVARLSGQMFAKEQFRLVAELKASSGEAPAALIAQWKGERGAAWNGWLPKVEWGGERSVLLRTTAFDSPQGVRLESFWTREEVDRSASSLAAWTQRWWHRVR